MIGLAYRSRRLALFFALFMLGCGAAAVPTASPAPPTEPPISVPIPAPVSNAPFPEPSPVPPPGAPAPTPPLPSISAPAGDLSYIAGDLLYIRSDNSLIALRADTGQAVGSLAEKPSGHELHFSKDGYRLFLLRFPTSPYEGEKHNLTIWEYDAYTATLLRQVYSVSVALLRSSYSGGSSLSARISLSPDEQYLYLIGQKYVGDSSWEDWVDTIEAKSGQLLKIISLGRVKADGNWLSHKLSTNGSRLFISQTLIIANQIAGYQFTTIDLGEGQVIKGQWGRLFGTTSSGPAPPAPNSDPRHYLPLNFPGSRHLAGRPWQVADGIRPGRYAKNIVGR